VLDRYRLLACLGAGGFGVVWSARDELLHREVAVKRIPISPDGDSERATREALASARLAHPAIVALYEACPVADAFYLISELINGHTLAQLIAARSLEDEQILQIGLALSGALEHAHSRGVIHRDVKPQNVLVPEPERWDSSNGPLAVAKLTDFGGASLAGEDVLTRTGDVLGTLAYMAPEQSEGREAGEPADLYSLALVLYEALCGTNPVRGATPAATARRIGSRLEPLERRRRDLPRPLTRALDVALSPSPGHRGTLGELSEQLTETLEEGLSAPRRRGLRRSALRLGSGSPEGARPASGAVPPRPAATALPASAPARLSGPGVPAFEPSPSWERAPARERHDRRLLQERRFIDERRSSGDRTTGEVRFPEEPLSPVGREDAPPRARELPRKVWLACALAAVIWQAWIGRPGVSLLIVAAVLPLAMLPRGARASGRGLSWALCALAPLLGLLGLAGAFPALAGQPRRWRQRMCLAALGYWWLTLAGPLAAERLWLAGPAGLPDRALWEGSLSTAADHVIGPMLTLGLLLGALLWTGGSLVLPWLVRGRSALLDTVAAAFWAGALLALQPPLDSGLAAHAAHPSPRGAVLGALLGAAIAVASRALRGPV
jgi:serine/threonine protein kinase